MNVVTLRPLWRSLLAPAVFPQGGSISIFAGFLCQCWTPLYHEQLLYLDLDFLCSLNLLVTYALNAVSL